MAPPTSLASPLVTQVLYKVCNSFVEMGSANVQATDYLKGVGQYFPPTWPAFNVCLLWIVATHPKPAFGTEEAILMSHFFPSSMEKWGLGGACLGILVWDPEPQGVWWVPPSVSC